ncbi:hypothetical protein [Streptococcus thermophilus]|uniref:hypothetical protein n=1 Tax=Streptococcus thermophilus TaxID=1308 RepID=UPI001F602D68|nr:hypothetical protein [Streptococcus thermophilus]MCT2956393.1 hypothetical protein [Streptococcus thermophilus]
MEKTVKMIADDIFEKLHDIDKLYTLEELAEMCRYKDGNILDSIESESSGSPTLDIGFNLEDFLSVLFHFRPYVSENNKTKFNNTIQKILKLIKENTNYSYDSKVLNKYSHTQNHKISNLEEWIEAENLIWDLFSYLFVQYFLKYNLSLKSDKNVLSMFSQLPTDIRFRTLQKLFEIKGYDNIQLIDKYLLAMVKSKGWEEAYFWLISHRKEIQSMGYPSENEIIEYTDDFDEDELSLPLRKFQNVFGLLSSVLRNPKVKSVSGGIYDTFEEAVKYFYEENLETYLSATREQIEFRELLYFCFIGRTQTN